MNPHSEPHKHGTDINSTENAPPASPTDPASASVNSTDSDSDSDSGSHSTNNDASANNAERKDHANLTENTAHAAPTGHSDSAKNSEPFSQPFTAAHAAAAPPAETQVTLRGPAELADALPYLMGFYPDYLR
ncbi:hypothetical protein ACH4LK_22435 [Streptomyces lydicus]|uniref:hypothetical protein n=1 Tax=Streptomyces lydicus TaxID=47763 RepID=UPI0037A71818